MVQIQILIFESLEGARSDASVCNVRTTINNRASSLDKIVLIIMIISSPSKEHSHTVVNCTGDYRDYFVAFVLQW